MESLRPMPVLPGPTLSAHLRVPTETLPASAPRPDAPPVTRAEAPAVIAPRPPDQARMGLVQAALLGSGDPAKDYSPERALKPWGVTMLPDSERAQERREANLSRERQAALAPPVPEPGDEIDVARPDAVMGASVQDNAPQSLASETEPPPATD